MINLLCINLNKLKKTISALFPDSSSYSAAFLPSLQLNNLYFHCKSVTMETPTLSSSRAREAVVQPVWASAGDSLHQYCDPSQLYMFLLQHVLVRQQVEREGSIKHCVPYSRLRVTRVFLHFVFLGCVCERQTCLS